MVSTLNSHNNKNFEIKTSYILASGQRKLENGLLGILKAYI